MCVAEGSTDTSHSRYDSDGADTGLQGAEPEALHRATALFMYQSPVGEEQLVDLNMFSMCCRDHTVPAGVQRTGLPVL